MEPYLVRNWGLAYGELGLYLVHLPVVPRQQLGETSPRATDVILAIESLVPGHRNKGYNAYALQYPDFWREAC